MRFTSWIVLFALFTGCSDASGTSNLFTPEDGTGGSSAGAGSDGGGGEHSGAGGQESEKAGSGGGIILPGNNNESTSCGDVGKVIFVVSDNNTLLKFDPAAHSFSTIGQLKCPASFGDTPFSMAVDRAGTAFVLYQSGNIFKVSTENAACKTSGYNPNQLGWARFGMAYVSDAAGSNSETLYVIDGTGLSGSNANKGLGKISQGGQLSAIGQFDQGLAGRTAEVTGLGDGRLFAFFVDSSKNTSSVAEVDKNTGKVISDKSQPLAKINAWAFAHWGGSFYLFNGDGISPSHVHKYTPGKGTTQVVANAGYTIVGAGVSTCAPTTEIIN